MAKVFPLRTAPSQMMASQSPFCHQVSTFICFGEKRSPLAIVPFASQLVCRVLQRAVQVLCTVAAAAICAAVCPVDEEVAE